MGRKTLAEKQAEFKKSLREKSKAVSRKKKQHERENDSRTYTPTAEELEEFKKLEGQSTANDIPTLSEVESARLVKEAIDKEKAMIEAQQQNPYKETILEEDLPGVPMNNKYGELETHFLIDGKYVPKDEADIIFLERKIARDSLRLDKMKRNLAAVQEHKKAVRKQLEEAKEQEAKERMAFDSAFETDNPFF